MENIDESEKEINLDLSSKFLGDSGVFDLEDTHLIKELCLCKEDDDLGMCDIS
jgi:hypothetical protein